MSKRILDTIMHPVRMRIITVVAGRERTASQIAQALPDVAQATLYRHIKALEEGDILEIVAENPIRGTIEKVYALANEGDLHQREADDFTQDDHLRYFTVFMTMLLAQFEQYVTRSEGVDPVRDGVGYHTIVMHLTDEELREFAIELSRVLHPFLAKQPDDNRKRLTFSTILMPAEGSKADQPDEVKEIHDD